MAPTLKGINKVVFSLGMLICLVIPGSHCISSLLPRSDDLDNWTIQLPHVKGTLPTEKDATEYCRKNSCKLVGKVPGLDNFFLVQFSRQGPMPQRQSSRGWNMNHEGARPEKLETYVRVQRSVPTVRGNDLGIYTEGNRLDITPAPRTGNQSTMRDGILNYTISSDIDANGTVVPSNTPALGMSTIASLAMVYYITATTSPVNPIEERAQPIYLPK